MKKIVLLVAILTVLSACSVASTGEPETSASPSWGPELPVSSSESSQLHDSSGGESEPSSKYDPRSERQEWYNNFAKSPNSPCLYDLSPQYTDADFTKVTLSMDAFSRTSWPPLTYDSYFLETAQVGETVWSVPSPQRNSAVRVVVSIPSTDTNLGEIKLHIDNDAQSFYAIEFGGQVRTYDLGGDIQWINDDLIMLEHGAAFYYVRERRLVIPDWPFVPTVAYGFDVSDPNKKFENGYYWEKAVFEKYWHNLSFNPSCTTGIYSLSPEEAPPSIFLSLIWKQNN